MNVVDMALEVASVAHDKQYRKQTNIPYISHPAAVGMMLIKAGYGEDLVAAGILHDTVEDTDLTLEEVEKVFGPKIAGIVEGCSEPDKSLSWEDRKEHTIQFIKTASEEIRVVSCADKLHNVRSILIEFEQNGDLVWTRFKRGREQQQWYYENIIESLGYQSEFPLLNEFKSAVEKLFSKHISESDFSITEDAGLDKDDIIDRIHPNKNKTN
ncbi:HD domain-containing protein [Mesobacillus harenae]|uniref:HD domain-containing protein n=1 Tax=Mesobacillus harenae TaxID=2213203 RepID=UPI0015806CCE|nr:HD domain-containing protein [Mesobacillus harenae]